MQKCFLNFSLSLPRCSLEPFPLALKEQVSWDHRISSWADSEGLAGSGESQEAPG